MSPNRNYIKGRKLEYELKKMYEELGCTCLRTAGSHGFADLVVINKAGVMFVQAKVCKSETEAKRMITRFKKSPFLALSDRYEQVFVVKVPRVGLFMGSTIEQVINVE